MPWGCASAARACSRRGCPDCGGTRRPPRRDLAPYAARAFSLAASRMPATWRWFSRSNKEAPSPERGGEQLQELALAGIHRGAIDVPPVALIERQRLFGRELIDS